MLTLAHKVKSATRLLLLAQLFCSGGCRPQSTTSDAAFFGNKPAVAPCPGIIQESAHFRICFNTSGPEAVPSTMYAVQLSQYLETAWKVIVEDYGYTKAKNALGSNGRMEVFVGTTGEATTLGLAFPNGSKKQGSPVQPRQKEAHMYMRHDATDNKKLQHVAAHEFFHLVQFQYMSEFTTFWSAANWLLEATAVQTAEEVFHTGEHRSFPGLTTVFSGGNNRSLEMGMENIYSGTTLFQYLHEKYKTPQALKDTFGNVGLLTTHEAFLKDYVSRLPGKPTLANVFRDYWKWNYFSGLRAHKGQESYAEAELYAPAPFQDKADLIARLGGEMDSWKKSEKVNRSASQIFRIIPTSATLASLQLKVSGSPECIRAFRATKFKDKSYQVADIPSDNSPQLIPNFTTLDTVDVVVTNGCFDALDAKDITVQATIQR